MGHADRERSAAELNMITRVRAITKQLPDVEVVVDGFGHTTFKKSGKSFVMVGGGMDGRTGSLSIKSDSITQAALIRRGPYVRTPYIGQHGWVTLFGDAHIDWDDVAELIRDAYALVTRKKR